MDDTGRTVSEDAFAALGHEIRLDVLRAFFEDREPIDPESLSTVRERRTKSYSELMAATGVADSGKFNYHLEQLRGTYLEAAEGGYVPTAGAIALYEAVVANRPTESLAADLDVDAACPNCGSALRGRSEGEYLTVDCPDCELFWGATYRFPENGIAVRDGEGVYAALYDRLLHHVALARRGQCPTCAGRTDVSVPRERLDGHATPTAELSCGTCSWVATVDAVSAVQLEPRVASALLDVGVPLDEPGGVRATERLLPDVTGRVRSEDPFRAAVTVPCGDAVAEIVVDDDLAVRSVAVE